MKIIVYKEDLIEACEKSIRANKNLVGREYKRLLEKYLNCHWLSDPFRKRSKKSFKEVVAFYYKSGSFCGDDVIRTTSWELWDLDFTIGEREKIISQCHKDLRTHVIEIDEDIYKWAKRYLPDYEDNSNPWYTTTYKRKNGV